MTPIKSDSFHQEENPKKRTKDKPEKQFQTNKTPYHRSGDDDEAKAVESSMDEMNDIAESSATEQMDNIEEEESKSSYLASDGGRRSEISDDIAAKSYKTFKSLKSKIHRKRKNKKEQK